MTEQLYPLYYDELVRFLTGLYTYPAWQKRHPLIQPLKSSNTTLS